jgi:hypothetical protein
MKSVREKRLGQRVPYFSADAEQVILGRAIQFIILYDEGEYLTICGAVANAVAA